MAPEGEQAAVTVLHDEFASVPERVGQTSRELDLALTAGRDDKKAVALPVAAAKIAIQGQIASANSPGKDAKEIVLTVSLTTGVTQMQAWFQNAQDEDLAGAFYAYVRLLPAPKPK